MYNKTCKECGWVLHSTPYGICRRVGGNEFPTVNLADPACPEFRNPDTYCHPEDIDTDPIAHAALKINR